jgi:hypothetical protein
MVAVPYYVVAALGALLSWLARPVRRRSRSVAPSVTPCG